jgi:hypothetical protein
MDPATLLPLADAIPVNWLWFQVLLTTTTFLHLVAMNIMLGTGFIAFVAPLAGGEQMHPLSRTVAGTLPYSIALAINFGVAPLLFIQTLYGQFFYTSTVLLAVFWLAIFLLLIVSHYSVYLFNLRYDKTGHNSVLLGLVVILLLVVGFIFTNNISMMQRPDSWLAYFQNRNGTLLALDDIALIPRYLHFMLASLSVGGLAIAVYYEFKRRRGAEGVERWITYGCNWFSVSSLINFMVGFWFLSRLYGTIINPADPAGKVFFIFVICAIISIAIAVINAQSERVYRAAGWTMTTIFFMTVAREILRNTYLRDYVNLTELPVASQYSPLLVFLIVLAGAGWLIYWMLKKVWSEMEVKS